MLLASNATFKFEKYIGLIPEKLFLKNDECASKLFLHSFPVLNISNSVTTLSGNLEKSSSANLIEWQEKWSFRY